MPIYEYRCKSCERAFDLMRGFGQKDAPALCPECGSAETMRLLSLFSASVGGQGDMCETSAAWGGPCCRTIPGGGG